MKFQLANLWRSGAFLSTLLVFALLNAASWTRYRYFPTTDGTQSSVGFPFPLFIDDRFEGTSQFFLLGLLLDLAVALTLALLVTWLAEALRR